MYIYLFIYMYTCAYICTHNTHLYTYVLRCPLGDSWTSSADHLAVVAATLYEMTTAGSKLECEVSFTGSCRARPQRRLSGTDQMSRGRCAAAGLAGCAAGDTNN